MAEFDNKTCARLEVYEDHHDLTVKKTLFVKSVWEPTSSSPTSFSPAVSDGHQGWTFEGGFPSSRAFSFFMMHLIARMFCFSLGLSIVHCLSV